MCVSNKTMCSFVLSILSSGKKRCNFDCHRKWAEILVWTELIIYPNACSWHVTDRRLCISSQHEKNCYSWWATHHSEASQLSCWEKLHFRNTITPHGPTKKAGKSNRKKVRCKSRFYPMEKCSLPVRVCPVKKHSVDPRQGDSTTEKQSICNSPGTQANVCAEI